MEKESVVRDELRQLSQRSSRPACLLHWDLTVAEANPAAIEACARWNQKSSSARFKRQPFQLPATLREACTELKGRWHASLRLNSTEGIAETVSVCHPTRPGLHTTIFLHVHRAEPLGKRRFVIEFFHESSHSTAAAAAAVHFQALTAIRRQLIQLFCDGCSNQEIATETGKALGTIKNALRSLYRKLGVPSRSAIIARVAPLARLESARRLPGKQAIRRLLPSLGTRASRRHLRTGARLREQASVLLGPLLVYVLTRAP
jgi:DNA-binding CsgD family transcriptional regulator